MRKIGKVAVAVAVAVLMAGCGSNGAEGEAPSGAASAGDERVFPGGQPLEHYKGMESYEWRVAIVDEQDELLADMQAIAPHLDEGDFTDVVSTCDAIHNRGVDGQQLVDESVVRFSGSDEVTPDQAQALNELAATRVCP